MVQCQPNKGMPHCFDLASRVTTRFQPPAQNVGRVSSVLFGVVALAACVREGTPQQYVPEADRTHEIGL